MAPWYSSPAESKHGEKRSTIEDARKNILNNEDIFWSVSLEKNQFHEKLSDRTREIVLPIGSISNTICRQVSAEC